MTRPPKKSETLEIRLPYPTKQAFMARCREDGRTASDALRGFIEERLEPAARRPGKAAARLMVGALLAAAAGAVALPSLARPSAGAEFQRLDADRSGTVTVAEFQRLDRNRDGVVTAEEFRGR